MCSLQEHIDRSARERQAQKEEPIYTELAGERGIEYEPPRLAEGGHLDLEDIRARTGEVLRRIHIAPYIN